MSDLWIVISVWIGVACTIVLVKFLAWAIPKMKKWNEK